MIDEGTRREAPEASVIHPHLRDRPRALLPALAPRWGITPSARWGIAPSARWGIAPSRR